MLATASWSTWYNRMGHPGNKKRSTLASINEIGITGGKEPPEHCTNCLLSKPRRTPVRSTAVRSGNNVVQVNVMSWPSKGWKGDQYAAVFSHRGTKLDVVFIYSRKDEAAKALKEYFAIVRKNWQSHLTQSRPTPGRNFYHTNGSKSTKKEEYHSNTARSTTKH